MWGLSKLYEIAALQSFFLPVRMPISCGSTCNLHMIIHVNCWSYYQMIATTAAFTPMINKIRILDVRESKYSELTVKRQISIKEG